MAHKRGRDCQMPSNPGKSWSCTVCGQVWDWYPNAGKGFDLWHGNENVRTTSGSKPKTTLWDWLTSS